MSDLDKMMGVLEPKRTKAKEEETNDTLINAIDAEVGDSYAYSSSELYGQMAQAWRHYYRQELASEVGQEADDNGDGYSRWVSPMVMNNVNQIRAFVTQQFNRNAAPIIKFSPKSNADVASAALANEYINYLFRQKLDGNDIVDKCVFNAALLKMCPVRVYMKEEREVEEYEFKYYGDDMEEMIEQLAYFYVANPDLKDMKPYKKVDNHKDDGTMFHHYRWKTEVVKSKYPSIQVINPGQFFVSRQAESLEDARLVCHMDQITISELKTMYPDAPKLNGFKKRDYDMFWEELTSDYQEWYQELEWLSKWSYDSLGYTTQYDSLAKEDAGLGAKQLFVMDAEIKADPDDTGYTQLYHVVKCGNKLLHKECIAERSFLCGTLVPTGNKWVGLSLPDLVRLDKEEETINMRAFTDAAVASAHPVAVVDLAQIDEDQALSMQPGEIVFTKDTAIQSARSAIEWQKAPGPDPSVLQAAEKFSQLSSALTGAGANFQGVTSDNVADMRLSEESVKIIDNNSSLMMNYFSRNFGDFLARVLVKLLNTAVKGHATNELLQLKHDWMEVAPSQMEVRSEWIFNADFGVNDAQEKQAKAQALLALIQSSTGGGGQDQAGNPIPQLPIQLSPKAPYNAAKYMLEAQGINNVEDYLVDPEEVDAEVVKLVAQQQIQQQVQQGIQQGVQAAVQQAMQMPEAQKLQAEVQEIQARVEKTMAETDNLQTVGEEKAFDVANKDLAEERREDESAWKEASKQRELDLREREIEYKHSERQEELEQQERLAEKAETTQATAIV